METYKSPFFESATVFDGMAQKKKPDSPKLDYLCPKCNGYGGWVLQFKPNSPGGDFRASCIQCNGWGWVSSRDAKCVHIYNEVDMKRAAELGVTHHGAFWHVLECEICGATTCYDSSG